MSAGDSRTGGLVACALFALTFGAVGAFAAYGIGSTLHDAWVAREWVRVRAEVTRYDGGGLVYRYRLGDKEYTGSRLMLGVMEPTEVDGDVDDRLMKAVSEKKPVTVWADPRNPASSVVDPSIPWSMLLVLTPFALGFGGVGLGAVIAAISLLRTPSRKKPARGRVKSESGGALFLWGLALLWNSIAIPISLLIVPGAIAQGEWIALLVLIFPLVGALLLLGACTATWRAIRKGGASLQLQDAIPRTGATLSGHVLFDRGVKAGDAYRAELVCQVRTVSPGHEPGTPTVHWKKEDPTLRVAEGPEGPRLAFRFEVPASMPGSETLDRSKRGREVQWRLDLYEAGRFAAAYTFPITFERSLDPAPEVAGDDGSVDVPQGFEGVAALLGQIQVPATAQRHVARQLAGIPSEHRDAVVKTLQLAPKAKKLVWWAVGLFILVQVVQVVAAIFFDTP